MRRLSACLVVLSLLFGMGIVSSCRGYTSSQPPVHPLWNMDTQPRGAAYRQSTLFENGSYMQDQVPGTIRRGMLEDDEHFYKGTVNGKVATTFPKQIKIDEKLIERGQELYNRYCQVCHSAAGDGKGMVGRRLIIPPTTFHSDYMYNQPPGHFFDVITHGIRNMRPYAHQIPNPYDRWSLVAYAGRVLPLSQNPDAESIKRSAWQWKQQ